MTYNLGIDIGIGSIGFAGVTPEAHHIEFAGVHIFDAAENPKDGSSLALPRREKRAARRIVRRRAQRKGAIRQLLHTHLTPDLADIDKKHPPTGQKPVTVWDLRKAGVERLLSDGEFARVLFHIAKRRGFQSARKGAEPNDTEGKKALSGAIRLKEAMFMANAPTIGAYLATREKQRNGDGNYDNFITRDLLREELAILFEHQRKFGNVKATADFRQEYEAIAFFQRPLQSSWHLVGKCELEKEEKRAPKFAYTAELFVLWSKLNNTRIRELSGKEEPLTPDQKKRLVNLAHKNKSVTYKQARRELGLGDDQRFNLNYLKINNEDNTWDKIREHTEKNDFLKLEGYHTLKSALAHNSDLDWQNWVSHNRAAMDEIARILSFYEDKTEVTQLLAALRLSSAEIERLLAVTSFKKTINLSLKAVHKILPEMQKGLVYSEACKAAGYDHSQKAKSAYTKLPVFEDIKNPVVHRALSQARKVINAVIARYGMPGTIIIELGRDFGHNFKERKDREREQKQNAEARIKARQTVSEELGILLENVSGGDTLKYRLWQEQQHICPYSGDVITPQMMRDSTATQIDHIIPYRRSWNDAYMNKVLCLAGKNQDKGNFTPFEKWGKDPALWAKIESLATKLPPKKAERILLQSFDAEKESKWKERALNDTRYMARTLKNHLEQHLALGEGNRVQTRNGSLTAYLRGCWGFPDKDRSNDRHHATDAIVLACSTQPMVQDVANFDKWAEKAKNPQSKPRPPLPWATFRDDTLKAVSEIFVSRMAVRKVTGAAHQDTIRAIRGEGENRQIIQRVKLGSLKLAALENLVDKERNYVLYTVLKTRLEQHGDDPKKAFSDPIYMSPVNDPGKPRIHCVRIVTNEKSGVEINQGLASNGDMVRVDVFCKNSKYFLVPIYAYHFANKVLPCKAIIGGKPEEEWEVMADEDFIFSLYKNDLVFIKGKSTESLGYYVGTDRSTASIILKAHDSDPSFGKNGLMRGIGVKTLLAFTKYTVDYFGTKTRIKKEKRIGVAQHHYTASSAAESSEAPAAM